jgi:hypothetical protein
MIALHAQEEGQPGTADTKGKAVRPVHAYRLDFSISELQDAKKINSRRYSINLNSGDRDQIKIGTRVPIVTQAIADKPDLSQFQYLDVGTNINCKLEERGDGLSLEVRADFDSLGENEQRIHQPIIRQVSISGSTLADVGKPVVIGSADDPSSTRTFQLEATVTKLK